AAGGTGAKGLKGNAQAGAALAEFARRRPADPAGPQQQQSKLVAFGQRRSQALQRNLVRPRRRPGIDAARQAQDRPAVAHAGKPEPPVAVGIDLGPRRIARGGGYHLLAAFTRCAAGATSLLPDLATLAPLQSRRTPR